MGARSTGAGFLQARHHAWAPLTPRPLEGRIRDACCVGAGRVDDSIKVVADLSQRVLWRFALKIAELVDGTALHRRPRPDLPDGASQSRVTVDDGQHWCPQPARDEIVEA